MDLVDAGESAKKAIPGVVCDAGVEIHRSSRAKNSTFDR
jgi:hypothetical protein